MARVRIVFNAPVVLLFSMLALGVYLLDQVLPGTALRLAAPPSLRGENPAHYVRFATYPLSHGSWGHLLGNLAYILLLGPLLEERYRSGPLALMMVITALVTGLVNAAFFSTGIMGASGIVFMFIVLSSLAGARRGAIPLTFILVAVVFLGTELANALRPDSISQSSHLLGGMMGALFGVTRPRRGR